MREIRKPDFQGSYSGGVVDPDILPGDLQRELRLILAASPLTADQKGKLIAFAGRIFQFVGNEELLPTRQVTAELGTIEANARRLLASLNALSPQAIDAIEINSSELPLGGFRDLPIPDHVRQGAGGEHGLMGAAWDWIAALEQIAVVAAAQYTMDRQTKPEQSRARGYVALLAKNIHEVTGEWPPQNRSSWFASFAAAIGEFAGYEIGPRIVASGIETARSSR